jgi:hypothetical protein
VPIGATSPEAVPTVADPPPIPAPPRPLVQPLAPDRYRVTFTASRETCELLELAQDLLRHAIPSGDPAQIVARALEVLVEDLVKQKFAVTQRPRAARGQADDSRNVPAEVRRAVFIRDRGGCSYIGPDGRRCGERAFVEFHHVVPDAAGGRPTVDNIALRCRAHNAYEAEVFYGPIRDARLQEARGADVLREAVRVTDDAFRSGTRAYDPPPGVAAARARSRSIVCTRVCSVPTGPWPGTTIAASG